MIIMALYFYKGSKVRLGLLPVVLSNVLCLYLTASSEFQALSM